ESCAENVTSGLASSPMTPSDSITPPCICGHASGRRVLICKPKMMAWGVNWQFCGDITTFPSFSFEQFYQAVRRCWRFGRKGKGTVGIVSALGESEVIDGLKRKQEQAERMFESLVKYMHQAIAMTSSDGHDKPTIVPSWLKTAEVACAS